MPFYVDYQSLSGPSGRGVDTALEAIDLYRELRSSGSGAIEVKDETGKSYSLTELLVLAAPSKPPAGSKDRAGT